MATITSLGAGTSLDLESILDKLQDNNNVILQQISDRQNSYEVKISAFSQLQSAVQSVRDAAKQLGDPDTMNAVQTVVSGDGLAASSKDGATPGQYSITIDHTAQAQRLQSNVAVDRKTKHGSGGTIEIQFGDTTETVQLGSDTSLDGVAKAINADDEAGVHATIVNDGNGGSYLMLTSEKEGVDGAVTRISVTGNSGDLDSLLSYDQAAGTGALVQKQEARDAQVTINDVTITSGSNTITDAIDGVTLTLKPDAEEGSKVTVTVQSDPQAIKDAVDEFVTAYNALQSTIANLTAFDVDQEKQNPLTGDSTTRTIQSNLASALQVISGQGALQTLGQLGITTNPDKVNGVPGTLTVDKDKLDDALQNNPADVARILAGPKGLSAAIGSATDAILGDNGSIKNRQDGLQETVDALQEQHDNTEQSMNAELDNMRAQFVNLSVLVAQMQSTSSYLTQQFASLSKQQ